MHKRMRIILASLLMCVVPFTAFAISFPDKPAKEHYYVDLAGLINAEAGAYIDAKAEALLKNEQIPVYVVTISSLAAQDALTHSIEGYSTELFNHWGVGWEARNYGMLLLISKGDRKARIELGAEWGRSYNAQAQQVMNELIIPKFKAGDFAAGIKGGVDGLDAMARGLELPKLEPPKWVLPIMIIGIVLIILMIINLFKTGRTGWAWVLITVLAAILFFIIKAAISNAGSGGGFGGGSSGGGGATGSW